MTIFFETDIRLSKRIWTKPSFKESDIQRPCFFQLLLLTSEFVAVVALPKRKECYKAILTFPITDSLINHTQFLKHRAVRILHFKGILIQNTANTAQITKGYHLRNV